MPTPPAFDAPIKGSQSEYYHNADVWYKKNYTVGVMVWLPDGEKIEDMITHFDTIHERDRQQDGQTDRQRATA